MSKATKKDLRNGRESGRWRPESWSDERKAKFTDHVYKNAEWAIGEGLPPFEAVNAKLNLREYLASNYSAHALHELGFKTLGETQ